MANFQIQLSKQWADYEPEEDRCLKRAFMSGFQHCRYKFRGVTYEYNFKENTQTNRDTGKNRSIRPPRGFQRPSQRLGGDCDRAVCITVKPGWPGRTVDVPIHGQNMQVNVPRGARPGQQMLVPMPSKTSCKGNANGSGSHRGARAPASPQRQVSSAFSVPAASAPPAVTPASGGAGSYGGWGTGAKVAAAGGAVVGAAAVGGGLLAAHAAEHGIDETGDMLGDAAADAGEAIVDAGEVAIDGIVEGAEAAGDWIEGAAEDVGVTDAVETAGDFFMDLF